MVCELFGDCDALCGSLCHLDLVEIESNDVARCCEWRCFVVVLALELVPTQRVGQLELAECLLQNWMAGLKLYYCME